MRTNTAKQLMLAGKPALGAGAVLGSPSATELLSRAGFDCETLDDFRGLNRRSPWFAFMMLLLMLSLAGLPPTVGFYAKLAVLSAAVSAGQPSRPSCTARCRSTSERSASLRLSRWS